MPFSRRDAKPSIDYYRKNASSVPSRLQIWWQHCRLAAWRPCQSAGASSPRGSPTSVRCSNAFARWDSSGRSSSTRGAVMVLPPGVNKATGLSAGLMEIGLSPLNVAAIGDAENDHAFLTACGCSIAVANALKAVKKTADLVTQGDPTAQASSKRSTRFSRTIRSRWPSLHIGVASRWAKTTTQV